MTIVRAPRAGHRCRTPWIGPIWSRHSDGDTWDCPACRRVWVIASAWTGDIAWIPASQQDAERHWRALGVWDEVQKWDEP